MGEGSGGKLSFSLGRVNHYMIIWISFLAACIFKSVTGPPFPIDARPYLPYIFGTLPGPPSFSSPDVPRCAATARRQGVACGPLSSRT